MQYMCSGSQYNAHIGGKGAQLDSSVHDFKGTVSWDRFQKFWQKFTELDLTKGRGWFLNFLGAPMILKCK